MPAIVTLLNPARRRGSRRRRGNPASLVVINGKRRKSTMAARRRRPAVRRRRTTVGNPRRRRTTVHHRRRRTALQLNRRRHHVLNPRRRRRANPIRRHRRRRNPGLLAGAGGLLESAVTAIIGMGITNFAYGFVGGMNPAGMVGQIGIKLGLAIGLRMAASKFGFAKHANLLAIGGAVSAGQDALNFFVGGGGALFPAPASAVPGRAAFPADTGTAGSDGVSDIVYANPNLFNDVAFANPGLFN